MIDFMAKRNIPLIAYIEPTLRCNHRCVHCYCESSIPDRSQELSRKEIRVALDGLARLGSLILVFTGGEVFLRPDLLSLVADARERGFAVVVFTNGTLIDDAIARALHEHAVLGVEISIHGATADVHDAITGVTGSFDRATAAIRLLRENSVRVKIKCSLLSANGADSVEAIRSLAETLDAECSFNASVHPRRDRDAGPMRLRLDDASLNRLYADGRLLSDRFWEHPHSPLSSPDNRLCGAGKNVAVISADGMVYPCIPLRLPAGNIRGSTIESIWNESAVFTRLRSLTAGDLPACPSCPDKDFCFRCLAMVYNETGELLGCSPHSKRSAGLRRGVWESKQCPVSLCENVLSRRAQDVAG
jgi:radical SAM protein with 4Fe4S-binding SPASM domain